MNDQNNQTDPQEPLPEENKDNAAPGEMTRVQELESQLADANDKMMRALAEAENTRRRAVKDREDAGKFAVQSFAKDLLDFADNFHRALESMPEDAPEAITGGLEAMQRELLACFERNGIRKINPLDEPFDPNMHEVMFEAPVPGKTGGIIIQVIEPGYVLNGRLLRAAKVGIAKAEGGQGPAPEAGSQINQQA